MLRKTGWVVALGLAVLAAPAFGATKLAWKFKKDDKFFINSSLNTKTKIEFKGQTLEQNVENNTVSQFTVKKKTDDTVVLEQKIIKVKMKVTGGIGGGGDQEKMAGRMKDTVFTFTLDKNGKVTKFDGYDDMIKKLTKDNKEAAKTTKTILPKDTFEKAVAEVFGFLPKKEVKKGDTWNNDFTLSLGPIGSFKQKTTYTDEGETKDGEKLAITSKLTYAPPKGDGGNLPFKVTKGDLKSEGFKGTIYFDAKKGRLVKSDMKATIKGTITMEIMDQEIEMTMEQKLDMSNKVLDKAPAED
jgi:hypothetical protein